MMEPSFETFDHTADVGLRVRASTLPDLLLPAALALYSVIGELTPAGDAKPRRFAHAGAMPPDLLRDYLSEVLLLFEQEHRMVTTLHSAVFTTDRLEAKAETQRINGERSLYYREVKAVTYHELDIREIQGGFEATFIVDI